MLLEFLYKIQNTIQKVFIATKLQFSCSITVARNDVTTRDMKESYRSLNNYIVYHIISQDGNRL